MRLFNVKCKINKLEDNNKASNFGVREYFKNCDSLLNSRNKHDFFFAFTDIHKNRFAAAVACEQEKEFIDLLDEIQKTLNIVILQREVEEITFKAFIKALRYLPNEGYGYAEEIIKELGFRNPDITYSENTIPILGKSICLRDSKMFLMGDTLEPEIKRIYDSPNTKGLMCHPVHYIFMNDDREIRKRMYRTLLAALYENKRVSTRRYAFVDLEKLYYQNADDLEDLYINNIGGTVVIRINCFDDCNNDEFASSTNKGIIWSCAVAEKYKNKVLTIFCVKAADKESVSLINSSMLRTSFIEIKEHCGTYAAAEAYFKMLAKENNVTCDEELLSKITDKQYSVNELNDYFNIWYCDYCIKNNYPQYISAPISEKIKKDIEVKSSAYERLMNMVGLTEVKTVINQAVDFFKAQALFRSLGASSDTPSMHMVFTGNPGTAKTTVARLFARILSDAGILSTGTFIECGRADIVGKYVGWTAQKVTKLFEKARGGVLFIDEAYSLADGCEGSYGDEAINTIVQEMENHRRDVIVIFAGYPDKMEKFISKNPGLRSRIAFHVPFADYNAEELCSIADLIANEKGFSLTDGASQKLRNVFESVLKNDDFGNGRFARNVIEKAELALASRIIKSDIKNIGLADAKTICADDIAEPQVEAPVAMARIGFIA